MGNGKYHASTFSKPGKYKKLTSSYACSSQCNKGSFPGFIAYKYGSFYKTTARSWLKFLNQFAYYGKNARRQLFGKKSLVHLRAIA